VTQRVAVFYDWQNVYNTAREAFGWEGYPSEYGNFSPYALGRVLAAGNGRGKEGELVAVEIHRGLPSQRRDPVSYAANRRQAAAWQKEAPDLVTVRQRQLRYPREFPNEPAIEKGVDVSLALAAVEAVLVRTCDVAIIFSHDRICSPCRKRWLAWSVPAASRRHRGSAPASTAA
jgi:uncharacterized LabA/DUF88 family protein